MFRLHISFITALNKRITRLLKVCAHVKPPSPGLQVIRGTNPGPNLVWIHQKTSGLFISTASCIQGLRNEYKALMEGDASSVHVDKPSVNTKLKKAKRNLRKLRGRKQKEKATDSTVKLLAELPFSSTVVWKELGFSESDQTSRKRKERGQAEAEDGEKEEKKKKKGEPRPNYFISIPITNQKIKQGVEEVQAQVLQKEPRLSRALVPVGSLHITLLVTHLATQEEVDIASLAVEEMESTLTSLLGGRSLVLPFRGVGHFRQEVGFVQIEEGEHLGVLAHIAGSVRRAFEEKGIPTEDQKAFKPHLTLIKLSKAPRLRRQGIKKLDLALFSGFEQRVFGEESVCSLDLCSMLKKKGADGYYHRERTVTFDLVQSARRRSRTSGKRGVELDDDELVSLSKRLVEDAVSRAVQQYMEETQQNGTAPKDEAPPTGLKK